MAKTRQQKEETVIGLKDKIGRAKSVIFADYRGLTMKQLSELRDKLRDQEAEFIVTKNTLLKIALTDYSPPSTAAEAKSDLAEAGSQNAESIYQGPTATLFSYDDEISPLKTLVKILKDAGIGKLKAGFLGKEELDEAKLTQLSQLPTKDELRAKTVGVLVAPLQGMVGVLQANLRNLVYALSELQKVKGGV